MITLARQCNSCKGDDASQWGKWEIRPLATPKPLNRSLPKVAHMIRSWISTQLQNLVTISQGVSFPRMCEFAHQKMFTRLFFRVLPTAHSLGPWTDFHTKYVKRRGSAQRCAFSGVRKLTFNPPYSPKRHFWARFWRGLAHFRPKIALQWECSM